MKDDIHYDFIINRSYEWMSCNIYHDDYCAKKKQNNKPQNVTKGKKEKKVSRLGLFIHKIIFEKIFHVEYSDYINWYTNHGSDKDDRYSLRAWFVRLLSIAFIPAGYFVTFGMGFICQYLYSIYENAIFPLLTFATLVICIVIVIGIWKASTIEFVIISKAKSKAKEICFQTQKSQHENNK